MKVRNYIAALLLGVSSFSCEDFLSKEPSNFIAPTYNSIAELETGLAGVYDVLGNRAVYGDILPYWLNVSTDISYTNTGQLNTTAYTYSPASAEITDFWKVLYQGIYRANLVLARVDNPDLPEARRNEIKGQALFLRAYYYFLLVTNFGDVPLLLTDKPNIDNVNVPRTPAKEVYEMIIRDMTEAEGLVVEASTLAGGGRVSKSAVQGLLARVCLTMAGYPVNDKTKYAEALKWANKVDKSFHRLNPSYSEVFINYAQNEYDIKESIWEVEFQGLFSEGGSEYTYYIGARGGIRSLNEAIGFSNGFVLATKWLYNLYEVDPNSNATPPASLDLRRDWNIATYTIDAAGNKVPNPDLWRRTMGKWRREYEPAAKDRNVSAQNFPILRYSDVLLMIAETENEVNNGPTPAAYEAINQVRRRAYGLLLPTPPNPSVNADVPTGLTKEEFFQVIVNERARELCFEAARRPDLIRWGFFIQRMKDYKDWALANGAAQGHVLAQTNIAARNLLLPIPTYDMALNKALTQNPGY